MKTLMAALLVLLAQQPPLSPQEAEELGASLAALEAEESSSQKFAGDFYRRYGSRGVSYLSQEMLRRDGLHEPGARALLAYVNRRGSLPPDAVAALLKVLKAGGPGAASAAWALGSAGADSALEALLEAAGGRDASVAKAACMGLAVLGGARAQEKLTAVQAAGGSVEVVYAAGKGLELIALLSAGDREEALRKLVRDPDAYRYDFSGWLRQPANVGLLLAMKERRVALAPELRAFAAEEMAKHGRTLDQLDGAQRLLYASHVLGGALSAEETEVLRSRGFLDRP